MLGPHLLTSLSKNSLIILERKLTQKISDDDSTLAGSAAGVLDSELANRKKFRGY